MTQLLELILVRTLAEFKAEAGRYYASFFWWVIEPVIYMGAFYVVFGIVFQRGGNHYVPFLLTGLVVWKWFASTVLQGAGAIVMHAGLIKLIYVPKAVFPGTVILANAIRFTIVFCLLALLLMAMGLWPARSWLALPIVVGIQFLFGAGCTLVLAALVPFLPDLKLLLEKLLMLMFFLSGVFFKVSDVPPGWQPVFLSNPMAALIDSYRMILLHHQWPSWPACWRVLILSIMLVAAGQWLLRRFDRLYPKVIDA